MKIGNCEMVVFRLEVGLSGPRSFQAVLVTFGDEKLALFAASSHFDSSFKMAEDH